MKLARELDIYIDETGDQSVYSADNPLYIVSFVCVESCSLNDGAIKNFNEKLSKLNGGNHFVHTGNLVRKERPYKELIVGERQSLFGCMFFFSMKAKYQFFNAIIDKKVYQDKSLCERVTDSIISLLNSHKDYFDKFSTIRVHYDGGQAFLSGVLSASIKFVFKNGSYLPTKQKDSPFMQAADMLGFMELIWYRACNGTLTRSDELFFGKKRKIYKDYIKFIETRKF
ncbi:MAG: DUF3800 domain-containing protein [Bacilli bacterium]|nr:DUF3800 domain-containing protein [Bacilli bacterium]